MRVSVTLFGLQLFLTIPITFEINFLNTIYPHIYIWIYTDLYIFSEIYLVCVFAKFNVAN